MGEGKRGIMRFPKTINYGRHVFVIDLFERWILKNLPVFF
jgi:hypothetical protein